jgi:hypothetical protein
LATQSATGVHPPTSVIRTAVLQQIFGEDVAKISSMAADVVEDELVKLCEQLQHEAIDLCVTAEDTPLPPPQVINHKVPIVDESKTYTFRPSQCTEALKPLGRAKHDKYLQSGIWEHRVGYNAIPMLLINKKPGPNGEPRL